MPGIGLLTGTTVVTVTFKNIKTAKTTAKKYRCVVKAALEQKPEEPATTAAKITAIKQTEATKLAAEFSADMTGIKYTDLKIVRDKTGAVVTVKSATVDKDNNTKVAIETYEALTDGEAYTVTYTATDEAKTESTASFTATAGVVADIALNTYTVPANTPTVIKYQLLDANGVLIEEKGIGKAKSDKVDISIENFNGYQNDNEVTLYKVGDTATLKIVYHTWKYNNTDGTEEGKVEKTIEITAVDQSSVIATYDFSVVGDKDDAVDFKRDTLKTQIAIDDDKDVTKVPAAKFSFRKSDGTDITKSLDYTVESGNENILLASGTVADYAALTPVGVGATYLVIKNASGAVVKTLPISVVAKRELSTMTVDHSHVTVSQNTNTAGEQTITVAVMDQYSEGYTKYTFDQPELKSNNDATGLTATASVGEYNKTIVKVQSAGAKEGTYVYTMNLKDSEKSTNVKKVTFTVTVSKILTTVKDSYALVMLNSSKNGVVTKVDTTVTAADYHAITLYPTIVAKNNGSIIGAATINGTRTNDVVSFGGLTLKKNGVKVDNTNNIYAGEGDNITNNTTAQVDILTTDGTTIVKNLEPGTYTLSLTATVTTTTGTTKQNMSTSFVVEDSQKVFEASVKDETVDVGDGTSLKDVFQNPDYVSFAYAGQDLSKTEYPYSYADAEYTRVNDKRIRVKKVKMDVTVPGTNGKVVRLTADVNRTFTFGVDITSSKDGASSAITAFNKAFVTSQGALIASTPASYAAVIASADAIKATYNSAALTDAERVALKNSYDKVMAHRTTAANATIGVLAGGNADAITDAHITCFNPSGYEDANKATYKTAIAAASASFNTNMTVAQVKTALETIISTANTNITDTANLTADIEIVEDDLLAAAGHTLEESEVTNIAFASTASGTSIATVTPTAVDPDESTNEEIIDATTDETQIVIKKKSDITTGTDGNYQLVKVTYSNGTANSITKTYKIALADSKAKVVITDVTETP